jgi:hypothetical protein
MTDVQKLRTDARTHFAATAVALAMALTLLAPATQAAGDSVGQQCQRQPSAPYFDCDCMEQKAAGIREELAKKNHANALILIDSDIARWERSPPSATRDATLARLGAARSAAKPDPATVSVESVMLRLSSSGACKSPEKLQRALEQECKANPHRALGSKLSESACSCVAAEQAQHWARTRTALSMSYTISARQKALSACKGR